MVGRAFAERYLAAHGADPALEAAGRVRATRYPGPVGKLWPATLATFDRLGPLLTLGVPKRASRLDEDSFHRLEIKLQQSPQMLVRLAYLLARAPLMEQVYGDAEPEQPTHPLDDLADRIREGQQHSRREFDVLVIGSGAGGAPLACALARKGARVGIVESGAILRATDTSNVLERYFVDQGMLGSVSAGGMALVIAGNAVGGTTVINSGTSLRPPKTRLSEWDSIAGTDFGDGALDRYLDQVVTDLGIAPIPQSRLDASARIVAQGLAAIGREGAFPLPRNAPNCEGAGRCCYGCPTGSKMSTDRSFVPAAVEAGASLFTETRATQIRETSAGVEVWVRTPTGRRRLRAKHLVLAAGAIGTPGLIRANKLGSRWKIAGDHLAIHPATKAFGMMPEALPHGGVPQGLGYHPPDLPRVTFEGAHTPPGVTAPVMSAAGRRHRWWMERHDRLANYGLMCRDRSYGRIRRVAGHNHIDYALHPDDARDLGAGLIIAAEAMFAAGAERVVLPTMGRDGEISSASELSSVRPEQFTPKNLMTSGFHPHGTAGMGRVVDANLALHGTRRVSVCDASALPASPGVNPQVSIMALSLRHADHLAGSL